MAPPKGPRRPACDPCRQSKLSCDRKKPSCGRCLASKRADGCVYRHSSLNRRARRQNHSNSGPSPSADILSPNPHIPGNYNSSGPTRVPAAGVGYPNPGYMGASSHAAIFHHIAENHATINSEDSCSVLPAPRSTPAPQSVGFESQLEAAAAAECMKDLLSSYAPGLLSQLLGFWRATQANLTVSEPLIDICRRALDDLQPCLDSISTINDSDPYITYATRMLHNTAQPLFIHPNLNPEEFCEQFLDSNMRLETIGILLCAIIRAASDIRIFPPLYVDFPRRRNLILLAAKLANIIVEAALSIDMLNDLQLILQYENFISHSFVFGVQSYRSFRKLGDVITSLISLGYHEDLGSPGEVPPFLIDIRRTALCRAYSADKNWSVFLGRPPRLLKRYCNLYATIGLCSGNDHNNGTAMSTQADALRWSAESEMSIWTETRWSCITASLKEEILDLFRDELKQNLATKVSDLRARADRHWGSLPNTFRIGGSLRDCGRGAWERDFLFVSLSREILALVAEVIMLRHELICSTGTSFEWKLAHYGLPAIGILLISMLATPEAPDPDVIRNLSIIVMAVELGAIVHPTEPNYALLSNATKTIQKAIVGLQNHNRRIITDLRAELPRLPSQDEHGSMHTTTIEMSVLVHALPTDTELGERHTKESTRACVTQDANNWSPRRKTFVLVTSIATVINSSLSSSLPANAIPYIISDFKLGSNGHDPLLVMPISLFLVGYVFGPLVFAPLSEVWGRQRLLLITFVAYTGFTIGCCLAPNWTTLLVFRLLTGIAGSAPLAIVPGIIADMYRDSVARGRAVSIFMVMVVVAPLVAPAMSGALSTISWRWIFWAALILAGATLIPLGFLPETHKPTILSIHRRNMTTQQRNRVELHTTTKKENPGWRDIFTVVLIRPLKMLTTELIAAAACFYLAVIYAVFYMYFQVYPLIFKDIYKMDPRSSGLMFFPIGIGACFSLAVSYFFDRYFKRAQMEGRAWTKREGSRRLPLACVGGPLMAVSMFWLGWTANNSIPWPVPFVSGFLFGLGDLLIFTTLLNYLADSYGMFAASAMAASSSTRSIVGAVLPFASFPMYDSLGIAWATTLLACLTLILSATPFLFLYYSGEMRKQSKFAQQQENVKDLIAEDLYRAISRPGMTSEIGNDLLKRYDSLNDDSHPVEVAVVLLVVAMTVQQVPGHRQTKLRGWQNVAFWIEAIGVAIESTVTSHAVIAGTLEGMEMTIMYIHLQLGCGLMTKLWIVLRRTIALAEAIGLPRAANAAHRLRKQYGGQYLHNERAVLLWDTICITERMAATMLNLPSATAMYRRRSDESMINRGIDNQTYLLRLSEIAVQVYALDECYDSGKIPSDTFPITMKTDTQLWHYYLLARIHLIPAITTSDDDDQFAYNRMSCLEACFNHATRYISMRTLLPVGFYLTRALDVQAFTTAIYLLLTCFDYRHGSHIQPRITAIEAVLNTMDHVAGQAGADFAWEAATAIRSLQGLLMDPADSMGSSRLTLRVPLLGTVHISRKEYSDAQPQQPFEMAQEISDELRFAPHMAPLSEQAVSLWMMGVRWG
ncbi:hypothetical protein OPT61_g6327 [Boeremia exigua]|uniref:Uncharacterized protein n=1 Tax=Boeremia exigua TaxID=749465 RepID=A0ACC2I701_9PLEO|nr:hypothetical protein OPT61_g6327 [Boeremia exigua]